MSDNQNLELLRANTGEIVGMRAQVMNSAVDAMVRALDSQYTPEVPRPVRQMVPPSPEVQAYTARMEQQRTDQAVVAEAQKIVDAAFYAQASNDEEARRGFQPTA